ncbi:MAG: putative bifunctional diguanylate cyclase/phosphodiesterase [Solirubrobacteraceae bacterium]
MGVSAPFSGRPVSASLGGKAIWVAYAAIAVLLAAYLGLLIDEPARQYSTWLDGWGIDTVEILAAALCLARAFTRQHGRTVPLVLGLALLSWSLGDVVLTVESLGGAEPPSPSLADALYLLFFPLAYVAIVLFMRGEVRRINSPSWLDSAVAGLGAAAVCAAFAFHSVLSATGGNGLGVATNLAYPVGDLLLLGLVVGSTAMLSGRKKTPWVLLALGMGLNVAGDTFNLLGSASGAVHVGAVVNGVAWPVSILVMSAAMWVPTGYTNPLLLPKPPGFLLPGLAALASVIVLLVGALGDGAVNGVAVGLAGLTLAAVGVRLAMSVRSLRSLTARHEHHSVTDYLTGLGNRRYLFQLLDAFFAETNGSNAPRGLAFLFIDLNRFKEINDSFGHGAGDEILRHMGERLSGALKSTDALVRLGGDEFAAVLIDADSELSEAVATRLTETLTEPFSLDSVNVKIEASIGIALAGEHASDARTLVSCADLAMYRAKSTREPFAVYESSFADGGDLLRLAEQLREAIEKDELLLHYQPQRNLKTGEALASEVLVRWPHPTLGLIPPLKFLPLAEQAGLMGSLTRWVLEQALTQCASWREGGAVRAVAVNISPSNLLEPGFAAMVKEQLEAKSVPPEALALEITETSIITDFEHAKSVIDELAQLGVVVSVDDFGTGFTSLAYLSSLAVGELKLDRTFTTHVAQRDRQLVRSTIDLGHALGLRVVAEGVEDAATLELLTQLGCDVGQGYFIGMPEPPETIPPDPATAREQPVPSRRQAAPLATPRRRPIQAS